MNSMPMWLALGSGNSPVFSCPDGSHVDIWRSVDGTSWRAYAYGATPTGSQTHWSALTPLLRLQGVSQAEVASHHYVVETDVSAQQLEEFTAWYDTEHMPGLARVPGTVQARRFMRLDGSPRFIACYDLTTPLTLERPEWLSVRNTPWSDRVRPMFQGPVRTMYIKAISHTS